MASSACIQTFVYGFPLLVLGIVRAGISTGLSDFIFALLGVFWVLGSRPIFSRHRAGKRYRESLSPTL